jgi:hypothetical protein
MTSYRWIPTSLKHDHERRQLARIATRLIRDADRRERKRPAYPPRSQRAPAPELPERLTFADLKELRRRGLVP